MQTEKKNNNMGIEESKIDIQLSVYHIAQSNLIEGIDDIDEDAQSLTAWAYLTKQKKLSHSVIQKVQKIITLYQPLRPDQKGYYRDLSRVNVTVGGRVPPNWWLVPELMHNWLLDYRNLTPKEAHVRFERIHPFVDGNGRTGRMLMWWMERQKGKRPTLIEAKDKEKYYRWFR